MRGEELAATVKRLVHEGTVRRIIIKHEGHSVIEIPLTVSVVGTLLAAWRVAVEAIGARLSQYTIMVVSTEKHGEPPQRQREGEMIHVY